MKMKYMVLTLFILCSFAVTSGMTACSPDEHIEEPPVETPVPPGNNNGNEGGNNSGGGSGEPEEPENTEKMKVEIKIGEATYTATLQNNQTAAAFKEMLPLTVVMNELNNNEKYYHFSGSLPTNPVRPGAIRSGDLMLYGNNSLVLFYKTFASSYSYTPIGSIDNPEGLETAVGTGSVTVTYRLTDK